MSDDVVAETMSFDAFERLLASAPSTSATTTLECERSSPTLERSRAVVASHGAVATSSDAYGAYVSFMRSGLWRDVAPRRDAASGGTIYMLCEPRDAPTERRRGEPRAKRPRSVAIPFAVSRACVTPAFLDVALTLGARDRWPRAPATDPTPASERDVLLIMIDSDGTTTTTRLRDGFHPPADVPEKTGDGDDSADDSDDALEPSTTAPTSAARYSDGESEEELLDDDRATTLARRHARPGDDDDARDASAGHDSTTPPPV